MKRSTNRFLTTHVGSLPRPADLVRIMFAKEDGVPIDRTAFDARVAAAVGDAVRRQREAGIDLVSDGEYSKPNYASYIKDRLTGFDGASEIGRPRDLVEFPGAAAALNDPGRSRRKFPACTGAVRPRDPTAAEKDLAHLRAALGDTAIEDAFVTAASPGVVAHFFRNYHYPSHEAYIEAIAEAMRPEYEAIARAGFTLQLDCPDLAMGRNIGFVDRSIADFLAMVRLHVAALNQAVANIPAEQMRLHLCWGNYDGPHHHDIEIRDIIDAVFAARPLAISFEAANPRHAHEWAVFETVKVPDGKVLIPGVIETKTNYIEHPDLVAQRIARYADLIGRENVIAGTDCGFGTSVGQAQVDADVVWAKLATLAEGARRASAKYWR